MAKYNDLLKDYRKLAKRADQRLKRLEDLSGQKHYKSVLKYAYARAQKDIEAWSGKGATRFNTKPPANTRALQAKINDINEFLNSVTSTKSGITQIYKKRADTLNKNNKKSGFNFKWDDLANYYESSLYKKLDKEYGSKTQLAVLNALKKAWDDSKKIKQIVDANKKLSDDEVTDEIAKKLLSQGIKFSDIYKNKKNIKTVKIKKDSKSTLNDNLR